VTPTVLNVSGGYYVADRPHALTLGDGDPVSHSGAHELALSLAQNYRVMEFEGPRGPWKVQTTLLRLAITGLSVRPWREDWAEVLADTQAGYEAWRTWPAPRSGDG